jgi:hypothetical protein
MTIQGDMLLSPGWSNLSVIDFFPAAKIPAILFAFVSTSKTAQQNYFTGCLSPNSGKDRIF